MPTLAEIAMTLQNSSNAVPDSAYQNAFKNYGQRYGNAGLKSSGYFGEIPLSSGDVATEYSIGVNIGGKDVEIPSIVPTLTESELNIVRQSAATGSELPNSIIEKAMQHAQARIANGQSPFWGIPEVIHSLPTTDYFNLGNKYSSGIEATAKFPYANNEQNY